METYRAPMPPDVSSDQRASNAHLKLIKKLRWMGMNDEEARVQKMLAACDVRPADSVIAGQGNTD
jgi:hypothetical protein